MLRASVYVDGFNLYHGLRSRYGRTYHWLDLEAFAQGILRPGQRLERVRYFTARVRDNEPSRLRQLAYLEALRAHCTKVEIFEGRFQRKTCRCRACQAQWVTYEEKESDVSLAVSLVEDAATDVYDVAVVISADSDLCPALRAAKRLRPHKRIIVVFPPQRHSDDLRRHADAVLRVDRALLSRSQLPTKILNSAGIVLERPAYWTTTAI
jgi:uncharacterized LabA/DUF88 family protein